MADWNIGNNYNTQITHGIIFELILLSRTMDQVVGAGGGLKMKANAAGFL